MFFLKYPYEPSVVFILSTVCGELGAMEGRKWEKSNIPGSKNEELKRKSLVAGMGRDNHWEGSGSAGRVGICQRDTLLGEGGTFRKISNE